METIIVKSEELNLPEKMAIKLKGKELELIETQEGILIKPVRISTKKLSEAEFSLEGMFTEGEPIPQSEIDEVIAEWDRE